MHHYRETRWPTVIAALFGLCSAAALILLLLSPVRLSAERGSPPPDLPAFGSTEVTVSFAPEGLATGPVAPAVVAATGWTVVMEDDFEAGLDSSKWETMDGNGATDGDYVWATRQVNNPISGGQSSAWGIGGGQDGTGLNPAQDGYPHNVDSWLVHGPVNMSTALDAELSFNFMFDAQVGDTLSVLVSEDGLNWQGKAEDNGGGGNWLGRSFSLSDYAGKSAVYIAFSFQSDDSGNNNKTGPFVDDVALRVDMGNVAYLPQIVSYPSPTPTTMPTPTPPPTATPIPPGGDYIDEFTDGIFGWEARRWNDDAFGNLGYRHKDDNDGGLTGFLEMELVSEDSFFIVSPLIESKEPPYNIEIMAKLKFPEDRQMYGIIFAGDWNQQECPTFPTSANCFNTFYELRVQYRKFDNQEFQEMKLKRTDSFDANGQPEGPTLIDWTKGGNVGPDDWAEIDIRVEADGTMSLSFNDKFRAQAKDNKLLDQRYFGLQLVTRDNEGARVKYDYIKITD